jgi:hypothetical protein
MLTGWMASVIDISQPAKGPYYCESTGDTSLSEWESNQASKQCIQYSTYMVPAAFAAAATSVTSPRYASARQVDKGHSWADDGF